MIKTSFQVFPIPIVGESYEHRSKSMSIQKTMNLIPQKETSGAAQSSLTSWYGAKSFYTRGGVDRGITVFKDELYKVTDTTLFKIDSTGTETTIGEITGTNRCIFANDGTNLIITTGGDGYIYNTTLSKITDTDFQNGNSVAYINQQMIYDGNGGKFQVSNVGLPSDIASNNFATAESAPDDTIRVFVFKDRIYIFGTSSTETWWNSGTGNPPVSRVNGGTMNIGLGAIHSVASTDEYMYFLGDDRRIYRVSGSQAQNITSIPTSHQIDIMSDSSDAIADVVRLEGQSFYILTFPAGNKTFVFNEDAGIWFNLSSKVSEDRYIGQSFVEVYGKRLMADNLSGGVLELDENTYTDNGLVKVQERIFGPITGTAENRGGERILMSWLDIVMEMGVGLVSGQGSNPQILVSVSTDGGESYTNERNILLGRSGHGEIKARYNNTKSFYSCYIKVRCTDPIFISMYDASAGLKRSGY